MEGKAWSCEEEKELLKLWSGGFGIHHISMVLTRTPKAIVSRLCQNEKLMPIANKGYFIANIYCTFDELDRMQERYKNHRKLVNPLIRDINEVR